MVTVDHLLYVRLSVEKIKMSRTWAYPLRIFQGAPFAFYPLSHTLSHSYSRPSFSLFTYRCQGDSFLTSWCTFSLECSALFTVAPTTLCVVLGQQSFRSTLHKPELHYNKKPRCLRLTKCGNMQIPFQLGWVWPENLYF